jgi:hypothetical protein
MPRIDSVITSNARMLDESVKCYTNPVPTPSIGDVVSLSQHLMQESTKFSDDVFVEEVAFPAICRG